MKGDISVPDPDTIEYQQLFEGLNDPCVVFQVVDDEPLIVSVNQEFRDVFIPECCVSDVFGENLNELIVPNQRYEKAKRLDKRTKRGDANEVQIQRETANGLRHFLYRGIPLDDGLGFGIYIDITQRRREREYIDVLQRVLRHNLRNDLSVIRGYANEVNEMAERDEMQEYTQRILEFTGRIETLSNEASTIRDIINQEYKPDTRTISVQEVAQDTADMFQDEFPDSHIGIECTDGLSVRAGRKIGIAFESIIDNGLRYNESDQPTVLIRGHEVGSNRVHITFADNGVGIDPTQRKIVISDMETSPLEHGSGLGLWVTKWVVESYEGTMDIHNIPNGGTLVEFWLNC